MKVLALRFTQGNFPTLRCVDFGEKGLLVAVCCHLGFTSSFHNVHNYTIEAAYLGGGFFKLQTVWINLIYVAKFHLLFSFTFSALRNARQG